jgi:peptidoglycan/xylan/chitin deacetylase (PgdA/CDA1 family)
MSARTRISELVYAIGDPIGNALLSPPFGGFGAYVNHGPRDRRLVALTFDDGPCQDATETLLDVMSELDVRGTFFCVGANVRMNLEIVQRLDREGHIVGSHSDAHERGKGISVSDERHIVDAEVSIAQVLGKRPLLYRPPWGWLTPWEARRLRRMGYTAIGWDVYTLDWKIPEPDPELMALTARGDTRPGSFVLLHDGFPLERSWAKQCTARTVELLVPMLRADGFEFTTVDEILGVPAYAPAGITDEPPPFVGAGAAT